MSEPVKRRRRPPISCILCRKRKIRCDKGLPCNHCVRSRTPAACQYDNSWPGVPTQSSTTNIASTSNEGPSSSSKDTASIKSHGTTLVEHQSLPTTSISSSPSDVDSMQRRIKELEEQLSRVTYNSRPSTQAPPSSPTSYETVMSGLSGTFHVQVDDPLFGEAKASARSVAHKTRVFGQSHWVNGVILFKDLAKQIAPFVKTENSKSVEILARCKALARFIKSSRRPEWPTPPTPDLPPKELADELLACYLRTIETVYRVLHLPTFRADYEALWHPDAKPDAAFLVQVKLILAIGAEMHDMTFPLRSSATRWIYEAETWSAEPNAKSRLNLMTLQTQILLLMAREMMSNSGDSTWISAGSLLRTAMYMGLHRDPSQLPQQSTHSAEMRRRLWNTILEISLQASLTAGGAPLIHLEDFDTKPPSNLNDEDLALSDPTPKPKQEYTQMTLAIALHQSFSLRLSIAKYLNDLTSPASYVRALQLDTVLRTSYRTISKHLRSLPTPPFATQYVDLLMNRYVLAIHTPFFEPALTNASCAYSRKTSVDAALKIWYTVCPEGSSHGEDASDMEKAVTCVSGFIKTVPTQASFVIALEIRAQLIEDDGLNLTPPRKDLLSAMYEGKYWLLRCLEAGETNLKGYIFYCVIIAEIEHLMEGNGREGLPAKLVQAAEEAAEERLPAMEKMAEEWQDGKTSGKDSLDMSDVNLGYPFMGDIDFMTTDMWMRDTDQMNWIFDETAPMW